jgi:small subunit ribosomal protein S8
MVTDPIADMLSAIKNAALARRESVSVPYSRLKESLARVLAAEGYVGHVSVSGISPKQQLEIGIPYVDGIPAVADVKRRSKPGLRVYVGKRTIPSVSGGMGITIVSTPQGVMTGKEAKKRGLGGELLCEVW